MSVTLDTRKLVSFALVAFMFGGLLGSALWNFGGVYVPTLSQGLGFGGMRQFESAEEASRTLLLLGSAVVAGIFLLLKNLNVFGLWGDAIWGALFALVGLGFLIWFLIDFERWWAPVKTTNGQAQLHSRFWSASSPGWPKRPETTGLARN